MSRGALADSRRLCLTVSLELGLAVGAWAVGPLNLTAIAAGSDSHGTILFAADAANGCLYRWQQAEGAPIGRQEIGADLLQPYDNCTAQSSPTALAYQDGRLYVADAARHELAVIGIWGGTTKILWRGAPFRRPADIAVSPEGVIVVAEEELGALIWLREGESPVVQSSERWQAPARVAFTSGFLNVLDRNGSLFAVPYAADSGGSFRFAPPQQLTFDIGEGITASSALTAQHDIIYGVAADRFFTYVPEPGQTIATYPEPVAGLGASRIASTTESLFVVSEDGHHLWQLKRPVPVEIHFELSPPRANEALAFFYKYLADRDLLLARPVASSTAQLDHLLIDERVLVGNNGTDELIAQSSFDANSALRDVLCRWNSSICKGIDPGGNILDIVPGKGFEIPNLRVRSAVRLRTINDLSGHSISETLDQLILSPELRAQFSNLDQIMAWNPQVVSGNLEEEEKKKLFAALRTGSVELPAEVWEITIPVLASDLLDAKSELRRFVWSHDKVFLLSKEAAETMPRAILQPLDSGLQQGLMDCATLRANREEIAKTTHYAEISTTLQSQEPTIGIIEKSVQVDMGHLAFTTGDDGVVWIRTESLPPIPETVTPFAGPTWPVLGPEPEDPALWHGSHVAAIIAARDTCGSGLLPRARLSLIHADTFNDMGTGILNASNARIRVVNVSQGPMPDSSLSDWEDVHRIIMNRTNILFVFAAGDNTRDLNTMMALPPVTWSRELDNVVVVTATNVGDELVGAHESNGKNMPGVDFGSKYVDLAAVGSEVYSATSENRFARASGASQAAPQIAAAAAVLLESHYCETPAQARARLIATADWRSQFGDQLWGGRINFSKALFAPEKNIIILGAVDPVPHSVTFKSDLRDLSLDVGVGAQFHRFGRSVPIPHYSIRFSQILSIQPMSKGADRYRIVFVNGEGQVRIFLDAELNIATQSSTDKLKCAAAVWDKTTATWKNEDLCGNRGFDVSRISEYYKGCSDYGDITFN